MLAKVVIVGRPNVGKSSIFNMLVGRRVSIVDPTAGVTRDRISALIDWPGDWQGDTPAPNPASNPAPNADSDSESDEQVEPVGPQIELIDTGGYGIDDVQDLTADIERQIAFGVAEADVILFVIDARTGIITLDQQVARLLRQSGGSKPIILVANKVDDESWEGAAQDAASLGYGDPICISATTRRGKAELLDTIVDRIDLDSLQNRDGEARAESGMLLAIVGKRNAGKSTLVNALAGEQRVIVSEQEGTTRDSVDVRFEIDGQEGKRVFTAIDTAGVRKRKSLSGDIEYYSHHRALRSVRRADVVLLLIDAAVPISQADKQLASEILKHHKPSVLLINKWDLAEETHTQEEYLEYLDDALRGFSFAPIVFISAKNAQGINDAVAMALNLYKQAGHRVSTGLLNRVIEQILAERTPVTKAGKRPKVFYVAQIDVHPPTIGLWVNNPDMFDGTYQRFLLNRVRDVLPFSEVPIKLIFRGRKQIPAEARSAPGGES